MDLHAQKLILAQMEKFGTYSHLVVNALKLHIGTKFNAKICLNVKLGKSWMEIMNVFVQLDMFGAQIHAFILRV